MMTTEKLTQLLPQICTIAAQAAEAIMQVYDSNDFETQYKKDDSPVTAADLAANRIITEGLRRLTPDMPIIAEESLIPDYETRRSWTHCWLVDPLDGTKEFVARNDEFCICIALVAYNEPIFGLVFAPVSQTFWFAIPQKGSFRAVWKNNWDEVAPVQINCATFALQNKNLRVPISRSHRSPQLNAFLHKLTEPVLMPRGSALKMMLIAEGEADYYPRSGTTMEWDTAAAQLIVTEAGGTFCQLHDGAAMQYNKADLRNPDFLAQGKRM